MYTKTFKTFIFALFPLFFLLLYPARVCAKSTMPYLSQEFVDTMVQNAFYGFVAATERGGTETRQTEAIESAKKVAAKLKRMSRGDPNRRYVLWRVGELEQQIYYEEQELLLKKLYKNQKALNILCMKFNQEVGKRRPSFGNLVAIHSSMLNLNPQKADELAWLIEDRDRNISREVSFATERYLLSGAFENAKKEYEYIKKNRKYLYIPSETIESFKKRIHRHIEADELVVNRESYYRSIVREINKPDIEKSRKAIVFLEERLQKVHTALPYKKYSQFKIQLNHLSELISKKEDSLVYQNMVLIHENRMDEAIDYMDKILRPSGVSHEKIAMVDKSIMMLPGRKRTSATDQLVDSEILALSTNPTAIAGLSFGDVAAKMRTKMDSVQAVEAERRRLAQIQWEKDHRREIAERKRKEKKQKKYRVKAKSEMLNIYTLLEENEIDRAYSLFQEKREAISTYTSGGEFKGLEIAVNLSYEAKKNREKKLAENKQRAKRVAKIIYTKLDQRNIEFAHAKFHNIKTLLRKYSSQEDFNKLEKTLQTAYKRYQKKKVRNEAKQSPVEQVAVATVKPRQKTKDHRPKKTTVPESKLQPIPEKRRETGPVQTQIPVQQNEPAPASGDPYAAFDQKQQEAQAKATQDVIDIYTLLETNQINRAYEYFTRNRITLKTYVSKEVYDVLESTVVQAHQNKADAFELQE